MMHGIMEGDGSALSRLRQVDLNPLVVLRVLLEERSVTRAAARLRLGQPAVSGALARLRDLLGDDLLVRVGRRMRPTSRAEGLLEPLTAILQRTETLLKDNMDKLHAMADALIKYETIDSDQIDDIMNGKTPRPPTDWQDQDSDKGDPTARAGSGEGSTDGPIGGPAGQH